MPSFSTIIRTSPINHKLFVYDVCYFLYLRNLSGPSSNELSIYVNLTAPNTQYNTVSKPSFNKVSPSPSDLQSIANILIYIMRRGGGEGRQLQRDVAETFVTTNRLTQSLMMWFPTMAKHTLSEHNHWSAGDIALVIVSMGNQQLYMVNQNLFDKRKKIAHDNFFKR